MSRYFTDVKVNVLCHARNARGLIKRNGYSPAARKEWMHYSILNINLNILVQHTMNTRVTNNAMELLHGQHICSSLINRILSNSQKIIKFCI